MYCVDLTPCAADDIKTGSDGADIEGITAYNPCQKMLCKRNTIQIVNIGEFTDCMK